MRRTLATIAVLMTVSCATAPPPEEKLSQREREALLSREIDRTRKGDVARIQQLVERTRREGTRFLARQESEARNRSIELYRTLTDRFPENNNDFMAEASFRLAELLFESERERIRWVLEEKGEGADLQPDFSLAIEAYRTVVSRFPGHPLVEDALYGLAYCYTEQGDPDQAAVEYARLIRDYPRTRYALEIHMRLGEHFFELEELPKAIEHYRMVADSGDETYADKALYKLGWCYYNLDRYEEAIDTFFTLLDLDRSRGTSADSLAEESIDIIARSYAERGGTPALSRRIASRKDNLVSSRILLRLAEIYKDRSLYPEAIGTFKTYEEIYPQGRDLPSALAQLGESYHIRGNELAALNLIEAYRTVIGPNSPWHKAASEEDRLEARSWILSSLESAAEKRRARFQAGGTVSELEKALQDVKNYLELVREAPPCRIRYLNGQILLELDMYPDAAVALNQLASSEGCGEWSEEAIVQSVNYQLGIYDNRKVVDLDLLTSSVNLLRETAAENTATPKALIALGNILGNVGKRSESRGVFASLIRTYPGTPESETARLHIARTFFQEDDYQQSSVWFKEAWRKASNQGEAAEAKKLHIYSLFKFAETLGQQNRIISAAERFEKIYRTFPDADVAQVSLYNAGKLYRQMGLEMRATDLFEELASVYQESDLAQEALQMSVLILEALGNPIRAAVDSMALAERLDGGQRVTALIKSADLFRAGGSYERASEIRQKAVDEYEGSDDGLAEQLLLLGQDLETAGNWAAAKQSYLRAIQVHSEGSKTQATAVHAARASLRIAQESYSRYQAIVIAPPIEETVNLKRKLLQEVIRNFVNAGSFKVAEVSTASNFFIGRSLEQFKDEILHSPRPNGLTVSQLEEYDLLLDEMAYPFEEKALQAYKVNIQRAMELEILDPWIEKSYHRMAELAPWAYLREEKLLYPLTVIKPEEPALPPLPTMESVLMAMENDGGQGKVQSQ